MVWKWLTRQVIGFVLRHLLRSNENTLLFFLLLKYFMMLKSRTLITLVYYYIIFYLNISTSPLFLTIYALIIEKKLFFYKPGKVILI